MAHESWAIESFRGEAQNQPGRITKRPDLVTGDFDRLGGISPLPYYTGPNALNESVIGYDWLGISAVRNPDVGAQRPVTLRDAQSGNAGTQDLAAWVNAPYRFYVPGGGLYALQPNVGTVTDPNIPVAYQVLPNGSLALNTPLGAGFTPTVNVITLATSNVPAGTRIHVVFIFFRQTPHGLIPVHLSWNTAQTTAANQAFQITKAGILIPNDGYIFHAYVQLSNIHKTYQWHRLYAGVDDPEVHDFSTSTGIIVDDASEAQYPFNSVPTFYGSPYYGSPLLHGPSQYTVSSGRAFYSAFNDVAIGLEREATSPYRLQLKRYVPNMQGAYSKQHVFYTDPGYLAFSDDAESPLVLKFDDRIRALTPSVRGIYAFSEVGTWEAYGDFATASGTRISLTPVLGGVDDDGPKVTFSGDTAYFVKEGIVHSIGPGGVKQVGRPVFLNRPVLPTALWYDRFDRRLMVLFRDVVALYDPNTDNWYRMPFQVPPVLSNLYIFNIAKNDWWINSSEVIESISLPPGNLFPPITVEFRKLDFGLPDLRKRLHVITFAYDGDYDSVEVYMRPDGNGAWLPCNVLDMDGYFESRCPTPTFRHLDVRIVVNTADKDFAINPPLVFTFTKRGKKYHAR